MYSTACESGHKNLTDILRELTDMGLAEEIQKVKLTKNLILVYVISFYGPLLSVE